MSPSKIKSVESTLSNLQFFLHHVLEDAKIVIKNRFITKLISVGHSGM